MASDIWLRTILIVRKETRCCHIGYSYRLTKRITHTMAFVTPVVEHWLEREIAQWVHPMKDRSNDPPHHERDQKGKDLIIILVLTRYEGNVDQCALSMTEYIHEVHTTLQPMGRTRVGRYSLEVMKCALKTSSYIR